MAEAGLLATWFCCFAGLAFLSVAEVAIIRVRRSEVLVDSEAGGARATRLLCLVDDLPVVLNTIFFAVLFLQVLIATVGGFLAQQWLGNAGITAGTVAITALLFLYAEAIPKTMAVRHPRRMALLVAPVVSLLVRVLQPVVSVLVWLADKQTPGSGAGVSAFSEDELRALAREAAESGVIADEDAALVDRSFEFGDRSVAEIMVDRDAIAAVSVDRTVGDALAFAIEVGHRRLPVYRSGLDHIVGFVRLRDLAAAARSDPQTRVEAVMSSALRCGPDVLIPDLLRRMQATGRRLTIVADHDDRTLGLATVEDVVAELVGEIAEEDPPEPGDRAS